MFESEIMVIVAVMARGDGLIKVEDKIIGGEEEQRGR